MNIDRLNNVFFLGIGGIGMSAIARFFHEKGVNVCGYDKTPSDLTTALQKEGMKIWFEDREELLPDSLDLVIYTPAVPKNTALFRAILDRKLPIMKRAELLGLITSNMKTIAIAGTHGKTTISTLVTHILKTAGIKVSAFLGGISVNYNTNFLGEKQAEWVVVEADEYDRSFLHLKPDIALISAIDPDHLDVYGSEEALKESFGEFIKKISPGGILITRQDLNRPLFFKGKILTYHIDAMADFMISKIEVKNGKYYAAFDGLFKTQKHEMGIPGRHNLENGLGAAAIAFSLGIDVEKIMDALSTFKGVKRRFEICYQDSETIFIDDYAHHPEEIRACIQAVRELFPGKKITAIFQPHLYSRTRDLANQFSESLGLAERLWLLDIYPARELPIEGINAEMLLKKIQLNDKALVKKEEISRLLITDRPEVLLTMGAGDIDRLIPDIVKTLKRKDYD